MSKAVGADDEGRKSRRGSSGDTGGNSAVGDDASGGPCRPFDGDRTKRSTNGAGLRMSKSCAKLCYAVGRPAKKLPCSTFSSCCFSDSVYSKRTWIIRVTRWTRLDLG